jgi:hypothetical protein
MSRTVGAVLGTFVILLACFPISLLITFLLTPLWSWIEATYGIESIGHSGPADWCFLTVYGLSTAASSGALLLYRRKSSLS